MALSNMFSGRQAGRQAGRHSVAVCLFVTLALTFAVQLAFATAGFASEAVKYRAYDSGEWHTETLTNYTEINSSNAPTTWSEGFYVVDGDVTISDRIQASGHVGLILKDGCKLTASKGIRVSGSNSLTIFAQSDGDDMGKFVARAGSGNDAAIGGNDGELCSEICIQGGDIDAESSPFGAGIGSGGWAEKSGDGLITINGGTVRAKAPAATGEPAGIGSGSYGVGVRIVITGGTVNASGCGKGIGCGAYKNGGQIQITGGTVTANGIGVGNYSESQPVAITGGVVISSGAINQDNVDSWSGLIFEKNQGKIYGSDGFEFTEDFAIPAGAKLTVDEGKKLVFYYGTTLTNNGELVVDGTLTARGTFTNNGTLAGTGSIDPKMAASVSFTATGKDYDGRPVGSDIATCTSDGTLTFTWYADDNGHRGNELTSAPKEVGTYWVKASAEATGFFAAAEDTRQFSIAKSTQNISFKSTSKTYDGAAATAADIVELSGEGDASLTWYADKNGAQGAELKEAPVNAGTYWLVASVPESDGYWASATEATKYTINKVVADEYLYQHLREFWTIDDHFVPYDARSSQYTGLTHTAKLYHEDELPNWASVTYEGNAAAEVGSYTAKATFVYDKTNYEIPNLPSLVTMDWSITSWNPTNGTEYTTSALGATGWINGTFTVKAADGYKVSTGNKDDSDWKDELTFEDETPDGKASFYVRKTDAKAISLVATESYKIDKTAPSVSGVKDSASYVTTQKAVVSDDNLASVTLDGVEQTVAEGKAVVVLVGNVDATYKIVATDAAGNSTTVTVIMGKVDELVPEELEDVDTTNVTKDNKKELEAYLDDLNKRLEDENLSEAEKAELEKLAQAAQDALDQIDAAKNAAATDAIEKAEGITAGNVVLSDKTALEDAKTDLETAIETYCGNYTEDEAKALNKELGRVKAVLAVIEHAEDVQKVIDALPQTAEPGDAEAEEQVAAAKKRYDALAAYERTLVSTDKMDTLLKALSDYRITKGDGATWTKGVETGLSVTANGALAKFTGVEVDGKAVGESNYTAESGSTIVTFKASYLESLEVGRHTLTVLYKDGKAEGAFSIAAKPASKEQGGAVPSVTQVTTKTTRTMPATGDTEQMSAIVALVLAGGCLAAASLRSKKKGC